MTMALVGWLMTMTNDRDMVLDVRGLRMRYGSTDVLEGVDFSAGRGEVIALLGPNGAGKTTTIEILEGFRIRSAGEVRVLGVDPVEADEDWRAGIGIMLQSWRDHARWRVRELLRHLGRFYEPYSTPDRRRPRDVDELIETVGLTDRASARLATLSGGERRRLDIAIAMNVLYVLVPGLFLFDGLAQTGLDGWLTFLWVFVLGLLATLPVAVGLGAMSDNPRVAAQWLWFGGAGVIAISGILYPFSELPGWLQSIGQVFPYYWLGLGMRSALLPDEAAAIEIDASWRHLETVGVLGAWAVLGLLLAPLMLRRMARRMSGSSVHAAKERAAQRLG